MSFSLIDEPWIPVLDLGGHSCEVSLKEVFAQADQLRMVACELPTQTFAILRLLLAILHRVTDGPRGEQAWRALWKTPKLPDDISAYLDEYRDRFDLLHPTRPFYQVADLRTAKGETFGLERIVADVPNGIPYLTSRAGSGLDTVTPAEAAIWVVHCQAFDTSGIKSGAAGDPRLKNGKVYPLGVALAGWLGGVYVEGATLRETLLLNLIPLDAGLLRSDDRDAPIWEREHPGVVEEGAETRGPFGVMSLYTWQSRRLRLYGDRDGITGAMVSYGDTLDWQDRHLLEPMSVWSRSAAREKQHKTKAAVYMPRPYDPTRALWRGLTSLLPQPLSGSGEPPQRLAPMVMQWLARLSRNRVVGDDFVVSPRAVSAIYGSQQSVIDQIFGDSVTMGAHVAREDSALRTCVVDAVEDAEAAVKALKSLANDLALALGGSGSGFGAGDRAAEVAYGLLDRRFRGWLARLAPDSDPTEQRASWQRAVRRTAVQLGHDLIVASGPAAWMGHTVNDRNGKAVHYTSSQAEAWFRTRLRKALSLADERPTTTKEEVPA